MADDEAAGDSHASAAADASTKKSVPVRDGGAVPKRAERVGGAPKADPKPDQPDRAETEDAATGEAPDRTTGRKPEPGKASDRLEWIEEADRIFVGGDVFGGDKNVYYLGSGKHRVRMRLLAPQLEDPARWAFAEPGDWADLQEEFDARNAAILSAPPGSGTTTVAIRLLLDAGNEPIYILEPDLDLRRFADLVEDGDPKERIRGAGFLLRNPSRPTTLLGVELQNVERLLLRMSARLIVVSGSDARLGDAEALDHRLLLREPPAPRAIFEKHLHVRMGHRAKQVLEQQGLSEAIDDLLDADLPRRRAAHLASFVQQKENDGTVDIAAIRDLMEQRDADDFTIWFDNLADRGDGSFAVALAVLDGLPYEDIVEHSKGLAKELGNATKERGKHGNRLDDLRARSFDSYARDGAFGRTVVRAMEYRDRNYPRQIINHFWHKGNNSEGLLRWLTNLSSETAHDRIRIRAANALGLLSITNFDHLYRKVFRPWSADESATRRDVVALALRRPAAEKQTAANVSRLIEDWHGLRDDPRRQATAARAYGMALRDDSSHQLLDRLGRLAVVSDAEVELAVGESLSDLIVRDHGHSAPLVLRELADWRHNYQRERAVVSGFLSATWSLIAETHDERDDATPSLWPTLLLLADQHPPLRDDLCDLWVCALTSWAYGDSGLYALTHWAVMAERDDGARQALTHLLGAVSQTDDRTQRIVRRIVTEWGSPDHLQPLTRTAAQAKDYLDQLHPAAAEPLESLP